MTFPLPSSFFRAEAAYLDPPEYDELDDCPWCLKGYKTLDEVHPQCELAIEQHSCYNKDCRDYGAVWVDYEPGGACETCGEKLGVPA